MHLMKEIRVCKSYEQALKEGKYSFVAAHNRNSLVCPKCGKLLDFKWERHEIKAACECSGGEEVTRVSMGMAHPEYQVGITWNEEKASSVFTRSRLAMLFQRWFRMKRSLPLR